MDDFVVLAAPGKREVADPVVPVGKLEVEDAAKTPLFEAQVPRREVAMDDDAGPVVKLKPSNPFASLVKAPP